MRTTLDIDDDVLLAARELARQERRSAGEIVSAWARAGSLARPAPDSTFTARSPLGKYGIHPLPATTGAVVTNEEINRIRDEEGI